MKMKKNNNNHDMPPLVDASQWYASGTRLSYDAVTHCIMDASTTPTTKKRPRVLQVFAKTVGGGPRASATSDNDNGTRARCDTQTTVSTIGSASVSSQSTTSGSCHPNNNNSSTSTMSQLEASLAALGQQPHDDLHQREQPPSSSWQRWITMLPGVPEGSFGFSQLEQVLQQQQQQQQQQHDSCDNALPPRLYLDYLGMGDSDTPGASVSNNQSNSTKAVHLLDDNKTDSLHKPPLPTTAAASNHNHDPTSNYYYSTHARADLVEALWHHHGMDRTVLVAVGDASTCVVMELMQRFQRRLLHGTPFPRIEHILILQGSILAPSQKQLHLSSTWKRNGLLGPWAAQLAQTSNLAMRQWLKPRLQGSGGGRNPQAPEDSRANHDDNDSEATPVTRSSSSSSSSNKDNSSTCRKRFVSHQLRSVVRRHQGSALLYHHTQLAQEHSAHKWKWHLPKLYKEFAQHQGITITLVGSGTYYKKQWKQTMHYLGQDYGDNNRDGGIQTKTLTTCPKAVSTTSLLLLSSPAPLQELAQCVVQLGRQEIPGSRRPRHAKEPLPSVQDDWSPPASISDDDPSPEEWQALKNWGSHDDDGVPPATSIEFDPDHDDDMMIMLPLEEDYLLFGGESCVL